MAHILPDQPRPEPTAGLPGILAALKALHSERFSIDHREYALIQGARALGATWEQIAEALGQRTAHAARERYETLEEQIGP